MSARTHIKPRAKASVSPASPSIQSATSAEIEDEWTIPAFLRISAEQRLLNWANWTPPPSWRVTAPLDDYVAKVREAERQIAEMKLNARREQTRRRAERASSDARHQPWVQRQGFSQAKYLRLREELWACGPDYLAIFDANAKFDPATQRWFYGDKPAAPAPKSNGTAKSSTDDTAIKLLAYDRDQLLALARANNVYDPRYETLPNPGLVRMTVGNRIRAKVRRGDNITWV